MATRAKICTGYTNHMNEWVFEEFFYQHFDGYPENILPILKDITIALDEVFEKLDDFSDIGGVDFIYYIDESDQANIRCSVLEFDWKWYNRFVVDHYKIVKELVL